MFYVENGKPIYLYNFVGLRQTVIELNPGPLVGQAPSQDGVRLRWRRTRQRSERYALHRWNAVGNGRVEQTAPMVFSADETSDVGLKRGSPMIAEMPAEKSAFNGTVEAVVIETAGESTDHLLDRKQVLNMIMARQ